MASALRRMRRGIADPIKRPPRWLELDDRRMFLRRAFIALRFNGISGDYVEFGVGRGVTFAQAYRECEMLRTPRKLWGFDSFAGLPTPVGDEDLHPQWTEGAYAVSLEDVEGALRRASLPRSRYELVKGFYSETLADSVTALRPKDIAFAYVDCDLYGSTKDVLAFLKPRLKNGMIIAFDDYFCISPQSVAGERKALREFAHEVPEINFLPYLQYGWHGMSFIVEDAAQLGPRPPNGNNYI